MYVLRLQKEWETVTKGQYGLDTSNEGVKLLTKKIESE